VKILFDQGTPVPLRAYLSGHSLDTAFERGWSNVRNGALLDCAEADGYQLLITTDQSLRHQQELAERRLAVLVLLAASWPRTRLNVDDIRTAIDRAVPGTWIEVPLPL
jgi:hypothetical protein